MSTASTTPSSPPQAAGAPAPAGKGGLPGSPNADFRAAVLKDFYKTKPHGALDAATERSQARTLGLAFLVFFTGIIGTISLSLNGLWPWTQSGRMVVSYKTDPTCGLPGWLTKDAEGHVSIAPAAVFEVKAMVGTTPAVLTPRVLPADAPKSLTNYQVRVFVDRYRVGVLELDLDPHTLVAPLEAVSVKAPAGEALPIEPAYLHAWGTAKLARLVPTRLVMAIGALMGIAALLAPGALVPFYHFWMRRVTAPLGWFNTRLILGIVFFLVVTPMALLSKLFGKDRLRRQPLPPGESYWVKRPEQRPRNHFERTF